MKLTIGKKYQRVMQKYKMDFLEDKIAEGGWSEQLGKKSSFYFSFIIQYIQHVRDISKNHFSSTNWLLFIYYYFNIMIMIINHNYY